MANIRVLRKHQLDLVDIRAKAEGLADQLAARFGGQHHWRENDLHYKRSGVDACIACSVEDIVVDIKLGMMMSAVRGIIEAEVKNSLDEHLT